MVWDLIVVLQQSLRARCFRERMTIRPTPIRGLDRMASAQSWGRARRTSRPARRYES